MAFNIKTTSSCKNIMIHIRPLTAATTGSVRITSLSGGFTTHNVTFSGNVTKLLVPVSSLAASSGAFKLKLFEGTTRTSTKALLIHCDIDCCLTKLTNELLACECDCPKCSSALAKAQKVFLLLQSALATVEEVNSDPRGSTITGYYSDIHDKYIKAKEICDNSCGCDC